MERTYWKTLYAIHQIGSMPSDVSYPTWDEAVTADVVFHNVQVFRHHNKGFKWG